MGMHGAVRESVGGQELQIVGEAPLEAALKGVVVGMADGAAYFPG
jgi:hypothetical protein